jgi:DNA-binding transcriptional LysR family regulator
MKVEIVTEGRLIDIIKDGFDAGVRLAEAVPQDMIAVPLGPDTRHVVVGAPSYFANKSRPTAPADLMDHECIRARYSSGALYRWEFERYGEAMRIDVPGSLTLDERHPEGRRNSNAPAQALGRHRFRSRMASRGTMVARARLMPACGTNVFVWNNFSGSAWRSSHSP